MKQNISRLCFTVLAAVIGGLAFVASAFSASNYASRSVLASGRWVKITVDHDGVYQLTASQLREMGFNDINRVKLYGSGGHPIDELLDGTAPDDLAEQPTLLTGDKLCFYGCGPLAMEFATFNGAPYFARDLSGYSVTGSYFLTEGDNPKRVAERTWYSTTNGSNFTTSYNWRWHEEELTTISYCGRDFLGEDLTLGALTVPFELTNISSADVTVQPCVCIKGTTTKNTADSIYYSGSVIAGGKTTAWPLGTSNFVRTVSALEHYKVAKPVLSMTLGKLTPDVQLKVNTPVRKHTSITLHAAHLDYAVITYQHTNSLEGEDDAQTRLYLLQAAIGDTITMPAAAKNAVMWNIDAGYPVQMAKKTTAAATLFNVARSATNTAHIAFDPTQQLSTITGYEEVQNQNIHAMTTPDMIILTRAEFMEQAQHLADFHHDHDNADILVLDEEKVFNEFTSGTRDAMAVRLMCKMFYDRNPRKFKYLLLFGQGSYDNRHIVTSKPGAIITFESRNSFSEGSGYAADDFFGILDDGSGANLARDLVRLGVGRVSPADVEEAASDIDKIIAYVSDPDYGPWRNNAFISADQDKAENENNMHIHQAQGICEIIGNERGVKMVQNKDFIPFFPKAINEDYIAKEESKSCPEAKRYMADALTQGQYFATYIGHAGSSCFTAVSRLWATSDVLNTPYKHWPVMTTACCNVARFDGNARGIAEHMFHKTDGGCIAMLVATREVLASGNDQLNQAFTRAFFTLNDDGSMPTLGQVTMRAKQSFGTASNDNKMNFMLLGDPMIKVNFPRPLVEVTKVNGTAVTATTRVTTSPMHKVDIQARVLKQDKSGIDNTFNGEATVSIYDASRTLGYFTTNLSGTAVNVTRRIDYPRTLISQIDATVVNGVINASIVLPRNIEASDTTLLVSIYAHKAGTDEMASGIYESLYVGPYSAAGVVNDTQAPVITDMYLGDSPITFAESPNIGQKATLHISVTDDTALTGVTGSMSNCMKLELDNGQSTYSTVKNYAVMSNSGKRIDIDYPINGLATGRHTLAYTVFDASGNSATRSIEFVVDQTSSLTLEAAESTVSTQASLDVTETSLTGKPELTIRVTDATGNLVWWKRTATFPYVWDLKDLSGARVPNGLYRYWGTYDTEDYYGGSPVKELIVVEP